MKNKIYYKEIDVFIIKENNKKYMIQIPNKFTIQNLISTINIFLEEYDINAFYKNKLYKDGQNDILCLDQGDIIKTIKNTTNEKYTKCKFHLDVNLEEADMKTENLSGILNICLLKYISSSIKNIDAIESDEIREIVKELQKDVTLTTDPKEDIKANLSEITGNNIMCYINYIDSLINEKEINNLINICDKSKQKEIIAFWSILSKYKSFNKLFEKDFSKAIEACYFEYSLVGVSIYQQKKRKEFITNLRACNNAIVKYLFHGTRIDPISKIITGGFKYARRPFYGMGIYLSDMLDYVSFYSGGKDFESRREKFGLTLPVNSTFSCVASEIFYSQDLKTEIYDYSLHATDFDHFPIYEEIEQNYWDKMIKKMEFISSELNLNKVKLRIKNKFY